MIAESIEVVREEWRGLARGGGIGAEGLVQWGRVSLQQRRGMVGRSQGVLEGWHLLAGKGIGGMCLELGLGSCRREVWEMRHEVPNA